MTTKRPQNNIGNSSGPYTLHLKLLGIGDQSFLGLRGLGLRLRVEGPATKDRKTWGLSQASCKARGSRKLSNGRSAVTSPQLAVKILGPRYASSTRFPFLFWGLLIKADHLGKRVPLYYWGLLGELES